MAAHGKGGRGRGASELGKAARAVGGPAARDQGAVAAAHPGQLDAVVRARGGQGVHLAGGIGEDSNARGASELGKAARAVRGVAQGHQGAVPVDAEQLDAVVGLGGHQGVHCAPQVERGGAARAAERQGAVVFQRAHRREGAVPAYPDQLDAVVAVPGDEGMLFVPQVEHGHVECPVKLQGAAGQRAGRHQGAAAGNVDQLDAVVVVPGYQGMHGAVHLKGRGPSGAAEVQGAAVGQRACRREGAAAAVYAQQLDRAAAAARGDDCVRVAAHMEGVDAVRGREQQAGGGVVAGLVRLL